MRIGLFCAGLSIFLVSVAQLRQEHMRRLSRRADLLAFAARTSQHQQGRSNCWTRVKSKRASAAAALQVPAEANRTVAELQNLQAWTVSEVRRATGDTHPFKATSRHTTSRHATYATLPLYRWCARVRVFRVC